HRGEGGPPPVPVAAADRRRHHREPVVTETADLVRRLYAAFSQDVEPLLTLVTADVDWPDGPARKHGKEAPPQYRSLPVFPMFYLVGAPGFEPGPSRL